MGPEGEKRFDRSLQGSLEGELPKPTESKQRSEAVGNNIKTDWTDLNNKLSIALEIAGKTEAEQLEELQKFAQSIQDLETAIVRALRVGRGAGAADLSDPDLAIRGKAAIVYVPVDVCACFLKPVLDDPYLTVKDWKSILHHTCADTSYRQFRTFGRELAELLRATK